ncbi:MAG: ABC transporter ATP-binding protein [Sarcina sp.]
MEIKADNIGVEINKKIIFSNMSFEMHTGEMIAIVGASGCGKTTLLNCLGLIKSVSKGYVLINGNNTSKWKENKKTEFWHNEASFIYQDYGIIEDESIEYNITLNKSRKTNDKVGMILKKVGLAGREKELAVVLSGGEKQRIGIARAIFKNATIIYADEPTASLDIKNRQLVMELLHECAKQGTIVVIATHDENLVNECDKIIEMQSFKTGRVTIN